MNRVILLVALSVGQQPLYPFLIVFTDQTTLAQPPFALRSFFTV